MHFRRVCNSLVVLAILIAVATALIAPSIDMPDTVLREHHVASHSVGGHASNVLVHTGGSAPKEAYRVEGPSRASEIIHLAYRAYAQSSVVLRC